MIVYIVTQSQGGEYEAHTSEIIDVFQNRKDAETCATLRNKKTVIREEELPMSFEEWEEFIGNEQKDRSSYSEKDFEIMFNAFILKHQEYHECEIKEWEVK